ncbi:MAG: M48 family metalloprotease [Rhodocyclaceae bacterium]|nr:M48 family metalloprotease [Rhodocyclaceae bacterium]MDZ4214406.1 M48 family metalloprotease [Rhodocyclaceae bacterium]
MTEGFARRLAQNRLTRRDVLWLFGAGTAASALSGCATSPIDGKRILVGMSEQQEREVDREIAPHQFSQDMGAVQDGESNRYVGELGARLHKLTHRPDMPYSYRVLNANHLNAYTFPGGAMGVTRGIMVELGNEAELAALLGHEMGHVNARHAAQRQGQGLLTQVAVAGIGIATADSQWGMLAGIAGQVGASALLASYSRDNEREADALGQEYMVRAGYPANSMTQLHGILVREAKEQPSLLATMFASHPMNAERYQTAQRQAETQYAASLKANPQRERFMDRTADLRKLKPTIDACKQGETAMAKKALPEAQAQFDKALDLTPHDYPSNLLMARCLTALGKTGEALRYAEAARTAYPQEAQAHKLAGSLKLAQRDPGGAFQAFDRFDRLLPGDPGIAFLKGVSLEATGNRRSAAEHYARFLQAGAQGKPAEHARKQLIAWGYAQR